jgi:Tfp pilus assembly protein PilV
MSTSRASPPRGSPRRQFGTTLLESLVAFLVLSLGMLSVVRVQSQLRLNSDVARQRSEAVRLAQEDLEKMRAFSVIEARAGAHAYASLADATTTFDADAGQPGNTSYTLRRRVSAADVPHAKDTVVEVSWVDRTGAAQQIALNSMISASDPAYSGTLKVTPRAEPLRAARSRSAFIPADAADLGNGTSAFKPLSGGTLAWVFNNAAGAVQAHCAVAADASNAQLQATDLSSCEPLQGYLLSGTVRFSSAEPPNPAASNDLPSDLTMAVSLTGDAAGISISCTSEARKSVLYSVGAMHRSEALPLSATAAQLGASTWRDTGDRFVAYHCLVAPASAGAGWSGRTSVVPVGWTLGQGPLDRRVCRYTTDLDRSGAIDANLEHPDSYTNVRSALTNQNFLVIKGNQVCPASAAGAGIVAAASTAPHQP